jgi:hypothetical protein
METNMKIVKSKKQLKGMIYLTASYTLLTLIICFCIIYTINSSIKTHNNFQNTVSNKGLKNAKDLNIISNLKITDMPDDAENVSFSYDDKYCTYLYHNEIYIKDIATNKLLRKITENTGISKSMLMNNRDIVLYFCIVDNNIKVKTYNIESDLIIEQKSISLPNGASLKAVDYSSSTNLVFVNLEKLSGDTATDSIYYLNVMKQLKQISLGDIINNMVLLNNSLTLYFEDNNNNLYCHSKLVSGVKNVHLIGCDENDNIYAQSLSDKSSIYVINSQKIINTLKLKDTSYIGFFTDKINAYAVYDSYIVNLSKDINVKISYDSALRFTGMGGNNVYFKDTNGDIVAIKRTI